MITKHSDPLAEVDTLRSYLERRVRGQPKAIDAVCKVYEYDITLRPLERRKGPVGVLFFLGPSGVGKTEMARSLAAYFSGSESTLVKIDCAEYGEPHAIRTLIGSPHSYIGFDVPPLLSEESISKKLKKKESGSDAIIRKKRSIKERMKYFSNNMSGIKEEFDAKLDLIGFLYQFHNILFGTGEEGENSESLAQLIVKDKAILDNLTNDSRDVLMEESLKPDHGSSEVLQLWAEARNMFNLYQGFEAELEKARMELLEVGEMSESVSQKSPEAEETRFVILFDEIEKAHSTLHQLLLSVMEDGALTLANGKVLDLRKAFIVCTSNIAEKEISNVLGRRGIGFNIELPTKRRMLAVAEKGMKQFSAAFRGRLDEIVVFRPLTESEFKEILDLQMETFIDDLMRTKKCALVIDEQVKKLIIKQSAHRPEVGARLLSHKLKTMVKMPVARYLARAKHPVSSLTVSVDEKGNILISESPS